MIGPTITLGGTAKSVLFDAHLEARGKLIEARAALADTAPNGRDYPDAGLLRIAVSAHEKRVGDLDRIIDEIYDVTIHIDEQS